MRPEGCRHRCDPPSITGSPVMSAPARWPRRRAARRPARPSAAARPCGRRPAPRPSRRRRRRTWTTPPAPARPARCCCRACRQLPRDAAGVGVQRPGPTSSPGPDRPIRRHGPSGCRCHGGVQVLLPDLGAGGGVERGQGRSRRSRRACRRHTASPPPLASCRIRLAARGHASRSPRPRSRRAVTVACASSVKTRAPGDHRIGGDAGARPSPGRYHRPGQLRGPGPARDARCGWRGEPMLCGQSVLARVAGSDSGGAFGHGAAAAPARHRRSRWRGSPRARRSGPFLLVAGGQQEIPASPAAIESRVQQSALSVPPDGLARLASACASGRPPSATINCPCAAAQARRRRRPRRSPAAERSISGLGLARLDLDQRQLLLGQQPDQAAGPAPDRPSGRRSASPARHRGSSPP